MTKNKERNRSNPFRWLFRENYQYVLAFIIPFLILWLAYICFGVYPVSNRSVLSLDLNAQYVNYFDYIYDVLAGKESLFYSWSRNLSGEFMGIVGYYLASPFNFLVWIFPRLHITEGLLLMMLSKVGSIGVCTAIYLHRGRGLSKGNVVIFSIMYALCSYTIEQTMNPMWLDGVMVLPLVVYGIEALIDKGRFRLLIGALIYAFVTNFYIGFMIAIFTALYFVYYLIATDKFGKLTFGQVLSRFGLMLISAITSVTASAFILIPIYYSLSLGKFEFSTPDYTIKPNFNLIEFLDKLLPNSYDTVKMIGLPFLYCGILTLIMAACYFIGGKEEKISRRKRFASMMLLLILIVSIYIKPLDMLWHGGQLPNWLPYRYSFMISFLLVIWAAEAFERLSNLPRKLIGGVSFGLFAVMIFLENMDNFETDLGTSGRETLDGITVILPAILILFILSAIIIQWRDKINVKKSATVTLAILVSGELFYNTLMSVLKQHTDITYSSRDSYVDVIEPLRDVVDGIKEKDDSFYRIEKNFFRSSNDAIAVGIYGISHSSSTMNSRAIDFLEKLGVTAHSHNTRYSGGTPLIDDLLGIKYILSSPNNETGKIKSKDDITIEENLDAMPLAYLVDSDVQNLSFDITMSGEDANNIFHPQSKLLAYMIGKHEIPDYFTVMDNEKMTVDIENVTKGSASGGHTSYKIITAGKNAQVKYTLTAEHTGELFLWLPSSYQRKLNVWVNRPQPDGTVTDTFVGNFFENDNYCIRSLGYFTEGERFSVTLTLTKDDLYFKDAFFVYLNNEAYLKDYSILREINNDTAVEKISSTHLKITTSASSDKLLFTSIPSEPGWTITVDGKETDYVDVLNSLIGVPLSAGNHVVEMKFLVHGYPVALYISGGGIVLYILLCTVYTIFRRKRARLFGDEKAYAEYEDEFILEEAEVEIEDFYELNELDGADTEDYDHEALLKNIDSIANDITEINSPDENEESLEAVEIIEIVETEQIEEIPEIQVIETVEIPKPEQIPEPVEIPKPEQIPEPQEPVFNGYDDSISSASDLFPDDEIAKLGEDDNAE